MRPARGDHHLRAYAPGVGAGTMQRYGQIMTRAIQLACVIAINRGGRVDVVDDEIEGTVVVEVDVRRPVREAGYSDPPRSRDIGKCQVAIVVKQVVGVGGVRHFRDQARGGRLGAHRNAVQGRDVIEVIRPAINARRDEQVLAAIVVEIGKQRRPAPVGRRDAGEQPKLAESELAARDAAIQLQRVAGVLIVIACRELQVEELVALGGRSRLEEALAVGQHVEHGEVGAPVVVEVGGVHAHRVPARVAGRLRDRFGEGAVAVVEIQKIVFGKVIGDVDVGAAVEIEVAHDHAETETFYATIDAGGGADVHEVPAVVTI